MSQFPSMMLKAGPLEILFEPGLLFARQFMLGETEVLRGVHPAVRDENWGTWQPCVRIVEESVEADCFQLRLEAVYQDDTPFFRWNILLTGSPAGEVKFVADGTALRTFHTSRTGFCVLHADSVAGSPCAVEHVDGRTVESQFPAEISPHQPFFDLRAIRHSPCKGVQINVVMEGDTFEMEDQRNWTDASFKTYCRPLALPTPYELTVGTRVTQSVTVSLLTTAQAYSSRRSEKEERELVVDSEFRDAPSIGLKFTGAELPPATILEKLRSVAPEHLRVELKGPKAAQLELLSAAIDTAAELNSRLFLSVEVEGNHYLKALTALLDERGVGNLLWMPFETRKHVTTEKAWDRLRTVLKERGRTGDQLVCGSRANFAEFNRQKPVMAVASIAACAVNPQVHAFDNASIIETLLVQPVVAEQIRRMSNGLPTWISPLTLRRQDNPSDRRLHRQFGAAWTLGSLAANASGGAAGVTVHGISGIDGILTENGESTPVSDLLANIRSLQSPKWAAIRDRITGGFCGLVIWHSTGRRVIIANLSDKTRTLYLADSWAAGAALREGVGLDAYSIFQKDISL